jgi:2,3-bisphosphoglycerate-independent phosphoglycerate mutase
MKYLLILADGMADEPIEALDNTTPLQYAQTPNIDFLAKTAVIGTAQTIPQSFPPGSDVANLSVLGYDPRLYYTGRSPIEAVSMGVSMSDTDLALRCNLVTLSEGSCYAHRTMVDYSAGEISTEESRQLIGFLQGELGNDQLSFHPGISYRHLLLWKDGHERIMELTPPHDISGRVVKDYLPQGKDSTALLELMERSLVLLENHPVNIERRRQGKNPALSAWFWGQGKKPALDSFADKYGLQGSVVAAVDLVKGLGICAGLRPVAVPGATGAVETNFAGKARAALNELLGGQDFVYMHIESPDEAGHQGNLKAKLWSIEQIDKEVVGLLRSELDKFDDLRVMIIPDHPTPLSIRTHSSGMVPYMIFDKNNPVIGGIGRYDEESAREGRHFPAGHQVMDYFIKG